MPHQPVPGQAFFSLVFASSPRNKMEMNILKICIKDTAVQTDLTNIWHVQSSVSIATTVFRSQIRNVPLGKISGDEEWLKQL